MTTVLTAAGFIRDGDCCRCGECCAGDPFDGLEGAASVLGACPLLQLAKDGKFACSNRKHPYYLQGCVTFPEHPDQIKDYPSCSYTFREAT